MTPTKVPESGRSYQASESVKKFNDSLGKTVKHVQYDSTSDKNKKTQKELPKTQESCNSSNFELVKDKEEETPKIEIVRQESPSFGLSRKTLEEMPEKLRSELQSFLGKRLEKERHEKRNSAPPPSVEEVLDDESETESIAPDLPHELKYSADQLMVDELPEAKNIIATQMLQNVEHFKDGGVVVGCKVAQYYDNLAKNETPKTIVVSKVSENLRSIYPKINNSREVETLLDSGSQIVSMDRTIAEALDITWDTGPKIVMQSADGGFSTTLGMARNVPFKLGELTFYFQVHILEGLPYKVLLGRPFDTCSRSLVQNEADGSQTIVLTDPNTRKKIAIETFARGVPRKILTRSAEESFEGFRNSMS